LPIGFSEASFTVYQKKVQQYTEEHLKELMANKDFEEKVLNDQN
jgi:hypothetical protein